MKKYPKFKYVLDINDLCVPSPPHAAASYIQSSNARNNFEKPAAASALSSAKLVVLAIISGSGNRERRDALRRSWARYRSDSATTSASASSQSQHEQLLLDRSRYRYFFMLASPEDAQLQRKLREESEHFGDMVQVGIADGYYNLTLKYFALLEWLEARCTGRVEYVVKVDDDMLVNVDRLDSVLERLDSERASVERSEESASASASVLQHRDVVVGQVNAQRQRPWRLWTAKWYLPRTVYPTDNFPAYAYGCLYLMSWGVVSQSLRVGRSLVPYLVWDDVFFTGTIRERARFDLVHTPLIDCTSAYSAPRSLARRLSASSYSSSLPAESSRRLHTQGASASDAALEPSASAQAEAQRELSSFSYSGGDPVGDSLGLMTATPGDLDVAWHLMLARQNASARQTQRRRQVTSQKPRTDMERWEAWRTWPGRDLLDFVQKDPFMFLFGVDM